MRVGEWSEVARDGLHTREGRREGREGGKKGRERGREEREERES